MSTESIVLKFSASFAAKIWKVYPDAFLPYLLVELRNAQEFQTSFALLNVAEAKWQWEDFRLEEPWWLGVYGLHNATILAFTYANNERPEPDNILAFEAFTCQKLWQRPDLRFLAFDGQNSLHAAPKGETEQRHLLSLKTGETLSRSNVEENITLPYVLQFPQTYREGEAYFEEFEDFFAEHLDIKILQSIDYLEYRDYIIISYFFNENGKITNNLLILDAKVQILLNENIHSEIQSLSLDTFFVYHNYLIFIRNNIELVIYQINAQNDESSEDN